MKINKLLLTTTALVSMFCMQSAFAASKSMLKHKVHTHKPTLHLNIFGWLDAQVGFRAQDTKYYRGGTTTLERVGVTKNNKVVGFDTAGVVRFEAKGKTSKGLLYVANIDVAADVNPNHSQNNNNFTMMSRTFIYLQDKDMGKLELGSNDGAAGIILPTANNVAAATGGVGGDWAKYVTLQRPGPTAPTPFIDPNDFHLNAGSLLDQQGILPGLTPMQKPRKISYYTPKIKDTGIQLGISYVPDASNVTFGFPNKALTPNTAAIAATTDTPAIAATTVLGYRNGLSGGISWEGDVATDNIVKLAVVGEYAKTSKEAKTFFHELGSVGVGLSHIYKDFSSAISFNYFGRSGLRKVRGLKTKRDNYVATLGFAYEIDKHTKVSITGLISEKWKNRSYNVSLGAQHKLAPGLLPYAEVSVFGMKQKFRGISATGSHSTCLTCFSPCVANKITTGEDTDRRKNRGASFIIGTRIAF